MVQNPVIIPFQIDAKLEIDCVGELRDLQDIPQARGDSDDDRDDGVVRGVEGDWRHHLVVALLKHQERAVVLIRLVIAVHDLVTPLRHAAHADHVSAQHH